MRSCTPSAASSGPCPQTSPSTSWRRVGELCTTSKKSPPRTWRRSPGRYPDRSRPADPRSASAASVRAAPARSPRSGSAAPPIRAHNARHGCAEPSGGSRVRSRSPRRRASPCSPGRRSSGPRHRVIVAVGDRAPRSAGPGTACGCGAPHQAQDVRQVDVKQHAVDARPEARLSLSRSSTRERRGVAGHASARRRITSSAADWSCSISSSWLGSPASCLAGLVDSRTLTTSPVCGWGFSIRILPVVAILSGPQRVQTPIRLSVIHRSSENVRKRMVVVG